MSNSYHTPVFLSRKKNDTRPGFKGFKRQPKLTRPVPSSVRNEAAKQLTELKPGCNNRLLAGCMALRYLTKRLDPARAEAAPVAGGGKEEKHESYAEVANLLKRDGVHIAGIVNPAQLSQWLEQI